MDLADLKSLEAAGNYAGVDRALAAMPRQQNDHRVLQYATAYFVRRGRPGESLTWYSQYLQATTAAERDPAAVAMAIECAHRLGKSKLVTEYFLALGKSEREQLTPACLVNVATAFATLGHIDEAETIAKFLRARTGSQQLRSFDEIIGAKFGDKKAVRRFLESTPADFDRNDKDASVSRALALALAHMAEGSYTTALAVLEDCKATVA